MCGILGYISEKYPLDQSIFRQALNTMSHRGPDSDGVFQFNNVLLGHKRLSIIDLSNNANQPMSSADARYSIVFNGEIYNFQELVNLFNIEQRTSSDTEVVIELFAKKGNGIPSLFNGMFAFAIFDKQNNELYIARDRMGIKPLFYFHDQNVFAFASELKALVDIPYISKNLTLNTNSINSYLHLGYIPQPETIYNNIHKFPSGHSAIFKNGTLTFSEYWNPYDLIEEKVISDEKEALNKLDSLLIDSVKSRMICDVPYGTLLSGGIDSSIVTAIASKVHTQKLKTYSIGFKDQLFNEAHFAKQVATHLNTDHHEYFVSEKDALELIPDILTQYDEPFADSSAIPTMLVSKMAAQDVKMVLSGDGGDELFHGYGAYKWANRLNNPIIKSSRKLIAAGLNAGNNRQKRASKVFDYSSDSSLESHIFSQEQYFFSNKEISNLSGELLLKSTKFDLKKQITKRRLTPAENQALFDINYYLKDDLLVKVDRASMKYSLEVRVPLLDYRIIAFALNLSPDLKIKNGTQKYLLKQLLYKYCPQEYFNRPKKGFAIPLNKWLKTDLQYLISENLSETAINKTGLFKTAEINKLITNYKNGKDFLYNRIWNLILLQKFLLK